MKSDKGRLVFCSMEINFHVDMNEGFRPQLIERKSQIIDFAD